MTTPTGRTDGCRATISSFWKKVRDNGVQAGASGAVLVEVYWPVRADYLAKAGVKDVPAASEVKFPVAPTVRPGTIYDLNDIPFTELQPGANSRLIGGHGAQLSFLRMDPGMTFAAHLHPEEQLMCVLRGAMDEIILDARAPMKTGDLLYLPAPMVHGGKVGDTGCDVLDVFYPPAAGLHGQEDGARKPPTARSFPPTPRSSSSWTERRTAPG